MRIGLASAFAVAWLGACGLPTSRPSLDTCSSGWVGVTPMNEDLFTMPHAMVWQDGIVYQATLNGVAAMPQEGGEAVDLADGGRPTGMWVEGDNVVYSFDDRLFTVPRGGGDATSLLDGGQQNDPSTGSDEYDSIGERQHLDGTAFYWTTTAHPYATDGTHAWRMLRTGGAVEGFALFPIQTVEALAIRADGVLAVGQSTTLDGPFYRAFLAPFGRRAAREIALDPPADQIISAGNGALLWNVHLGNRQGGSATRGIWISPADGSPGRRLSPSLPVEFWATWSIPDERGGHVLGGTEIFDDGVSHASVFQVEGDGRATRLACDPSANWPLYAASALAPDAIYLSVRYEQPAWMLVRLPR